MMQVSRPSIASVRPMKYKLDFLVRTYTTEHWLVKLKSFPLMFRTRVFQIVAFAFEETGVLKTDLVTS